MGKALFQKTKNKVFKNVTPEGCAEVFQKLLAEQKSDLTYPGTISSFYEANGYDPVLVMDQVLQKDLKLATSYFQKAGQHGLDPKLFKAAEMEALVNKFYDKKAIKTVDEAYQAIAQLEILTANSLIRYSNALQYGIKNPKEIYARYYTETQRPDSSSAQKVFQLTDIKQYLDSIQPKSQSYQVLQKALAEGVAAPGTTPEETKRVIITNLERLRWKNKPTEKKYVIVNIPDFRLDVIENGKSTLNMKVVVGQGRNPSGKVNLVNYADSNTVDKPNTHSTPQLNSMIHSVDVNPVWNIPESIASKEIMVEAAKDRYYLENKGIDVYKNGEMIDADEVDWSTADKGEYDFKQRPGDDNSLGKIKFLFNNKSSVYLHDTPAKLAFTRAMRALSHGCVRLGDPEGLAGALFGQGDKYQLIVKNMGLDKPEPTSISLTPKVPVYLTYITAWADESGRLQVRPDIYELDTVLFNALATLK
ncbi:L,D-transpeptidase family protein [Mucilaginibacter antarcticus]|uniref:L,D-transpeptidase family protein n=1 Tax=Mucilaginibacter antarcticus TaxID=1855725 RepID=A0ABW5XQW1_9SPHI